MTTFWNLPVLRLISTDRCRVAAPWFAWTRGRDQTSELRRRANELERRKLGATHPVEQGLAAGLYLLFSGPRMLQALWIWGRDLRAVDRVSYVRQSLHLCACAWHLGLRPQVYYYLRLHEQRDHQTWRQVIDPSELHHLQRDISPLNADGLSDKLRFTAHAFAHGLPAIPLLAAWRDGELIESAGSETISIGCDLFIKRARSYGSEGVMAFRYNPTTSAYYRGQQRYSLDELEETLRKNSRGVTLLVQPRLQNHPAIAGFSPGALCNYRIVTGRHPDGRVEVIMATLRFPLNSEVTCAETDTTLCAAVDLATGRLHAAESKLPALGRLTHHPVGGQQIEGFPVPRWTELRALACRAHEAWPDFPFIGWDLSDTTEGIYLLEGGCLWGGYLAQMSGGLPLGQTSFPAIYEENLAHRIPARVA